MNGMWTLRCAWVACLCMAVAEAGEAFGTFAFADCKVLCFQDVAMRHRADLFADTENSGFRQTEASYLSSVNVFLLERGGERFLIDAGNDASRGTLKRKLEQGKIDPATIKGIFITHIHPDHVGGLLWQNRPLFPNATLYIAREEVEAWEKDARRAALRRYLEPYGKRMARFEFDKPLPGGLIPLKRAGHTPGHTVFQLKPSSGEPIWFVGDILHAVDLQVPHTSFCAAYDTEPKTAVVSRRQVLKASGLFFGAHFPFPGCAEIKPGKGDGEDFIYVPKSFAGDAGGRP